MRRARTRFDDWQAGIWESRRDASHPFTWVGLAVFMVATMAILAWAPGARDVFQLRFGLALLCFLPALVVGLIGGGLVILGRITPFWCCIATLVGSVLLQFFFGALVALTVAPGAFVMAALFFVTAVFHAYTFQASATYPYAFLNTLAAGAGALALSPTPTHVTLFAVLVPLALGSSALFGAVGLRAQRSRQEQASLRAAIQAQVVADSTRDRDELSERLLRLLESSHDASSGLSALFFQARLIQERSRVPRSPEAIADMAVLAESLTKGLERIRSLLEETRRVRAQTLVVPDSVLVLPVVRAVLGGLAAKAGARIALELDQDVPEATRVLVAGGAASLERVLHNVLTNALEGDGVERGSRVGLRVYGLPTEGAIAIDCRDDGPGFRPEQLARGITAFATAKSTGTGLGLYTAERLLRAGGGRILRANRDPRGAVVSLRLPEVTA